MVSIILYTNVHLTCVASNLRSNLGAENLHMGRPEGNHNSPGGDMADSVSSVNWLKFTHKLFGTFLDELISDIDSGTLAEGAPC